MKYHAEVERDGKFWLVHVLEIDQWTQARNLREVDEMARDLIAVMQEVEPDSFELEVSIQIPEQARAHWELSRELHELESAVKSAAATEAQEAARTLAQEGLTLREIGEVLGVSHQRAGQLTHGSSATADVFRQVLAEMKRLVASFNDQRDVAWPASKVDASGVVSTGRQVESCR